METTLHSGILTSLEGRYAKALFELAKEDTKKPYEQVNRISEGLLSLQKLLQASPLLKKTLLNPTIKRRERAAVIKDICLHLKAPAILGSFMEKLVIAGRLEALSLITSVYQSLLAEERGEERVEVISRHPLTTAQAYLLKDKLKKVFPKTLTLTFVNDSSVLGGVMVRVGSRVIDATLVTQLSQLGTAMKGNG